MASLITIAEYLDFTNDDISALPGTYVEMALEGVSTEVRQWAGQDFGPDTYTDERVWARATSYNSQASLEIRPLHAPIVSVSAVSLWYTVDADPTALSVTDVLLDPSRTGFWIPFGVFGTWGSFVKMGNQYTAKLTYIAGEAADYAVKMAVALLCQEWFAMQAEVSHESADQVESWRLGDYQEKKAVRNLQESSGLGMGTQLSVRAYQLLSHYRRQGVVFL